MRLLVVVKLKPHAPGGLSNVQWFMRAGKTIKPEDIMERIYNRMMREGHLRNFSGSSISMRMGNDRHGKIYATPIGGRDRRIGTVTPLS